MATRKVFGRPGAGLLDGDVLIVMQSFELSLSLLWGLTVSLWIPVHGVFGSVYRRRGSTLMSPKVLGAVHEHRSAGT